MTFDLQVFPNMSLNVVGKTGLISTSINEEFLNNSRISLTSHQEIKRRGVFAARNLLCDTKTKAFDIKELIENSKENLKDKVSLQFISATISFMGDL